MTVYNWHFVDSHGDFDEIPDQRSVCYLLVEDNLFPNSFPFVVRGTYDKDANKWYATSGGKVNILSTSYVIVAWRYEEDDKQ